MGPSRRELATSNDLTELLRDLSPDESCVYRGVAFDTYHRGFNALLPLLLGSVLGPVLWAIGINRLPIPGDYIRVWLPTPLGIDIFLRSLSQVRPDRDGLDAYFSIRASHVDVARRRLEGPLTEALLDLAQAYHLVEMYRPVDRHECIEFGPLARRPEETTGDLSALIDVLNALGACEPVVATFVSPGNPFRD
jgi:hypothetical protein